MIKDTPKVAWAATALQCAGGFWLALNIESSPWSYVPMLVGSVIWTWTAKTRGDFPLATLQGFFVLVNLVGIIRWLVAD
jgi:hypothetical protein